MKMCRWLLRRVINFITSPTRSVICLRSPAGTARFVWSTEEEPNQPGPTRFRTGTTLMAKKEELQPEKQRETTVEFLASLAAVLVTGLFIITFILQAFEIPSSSMENTLLIGDHVFVNREQFAPPTRWMGPLLPYRQIRHGDIVVFLSQIG